MVIHIAVVAHRRRPRFQIPPRIWRAKSREHTSTSCSTAGSAQQSGSVAAARDGPPGGWRSRAASTTGAERRRLRSARERSAARPEAALPDPGAALASEPPRSRRARCVRPASSLFVSFQGAATRRGGECVGLCAWLCVPARRPGPPSGQVFWCRHCHNEAHRSAVGSAAGSAQAQSPKPKPTRAPPGAAVQAASASERPHELDRSKIAEAVSCTGFGIGPVGQIFVAVAIEENERAGDLRRLWPPASPDAAGAHHMLAVT